MMDSSNNLHNSFYDPFQSVSGFGFFNPKDSSSLTNLPPILNNLTNTSNSTSFQTGGAHINNSLCGLINSTSSGNIHNNSHINGGSIQSNNTNIGILGQIGFNSSLQSKQSPTLYNNTHSLCTFGSIGNNSTNNGIVGSIPNNISSTQNSPTSFFNNSSNDYRNFNTNKQFPITTFSIEDTLQGRNMSADHTIFNGRMNDNTGNLFNRSTSYNECSTSSIFNRSVGDSCSSSSSLHNQQMFGRSISINENTYRNGGSNDTHSIFSSGSHHSHLQSSNNTSNAGSSSHHSQPLHRSSMDKSNSDNSIFNSMEDMTISCWNSPTTNNSSSSITNSNNSRNGGNNYGNSNNSNGFGGVNQQGGVRETGIIEKLLHSYGFIQCCERQARLFFHFSQFEGTIEHLKLGDPVEFEMTYDRRTGKPIASFVTKIGPEVVLSEERVHGTVTTELHHESNGELQGRISYENRGECFFLPYCQEDIEGNVSLSAGDSVSFQIATNQRSGNLTARYVRLENPAQPVRYRGIVSSIKDNFGFIERADVAKEIFFHFAETRLHEGVVVGDNIEFNIQTRNGKEVAASITKLPLGTVVFEDICPDVLKGQVLKPIDKSQPTPISAVPVPRSEMMQGRLRYRGPDRQELEAVYGEKDQKGFFTMRHGDWVEFQLAVDRRDKQQRATNIRLLEESFVVSGERREEGVISSIKDGIGVITCAERDQKVSFNVNELLEFNRQPKVADDVEFTILPDSSSPLRHVALRIKYLPAGTVQFEIPISTNITGVVAREPSTPWVSQEALAGIIPSLNSLGLPANVTEKLIQNLSTNEMMRKMNSGTNNVNCGLNGGGIGNNGAASTNDMGEPGVISYEISTMNGWQQETIVFHWKDCKNLTKIRVGTKVIFDVHQVRRTREIIAANIRSAIQPVQQELANENSTTASPITSLTGTIGDSALTSKQDSTYNQTDGSIVTASTVSAQTLQQQGATHNFQDLNLNFPTLAESQINQQSETSQPTSSAASTSSCASSVGIANGDLNGIIDGTLTSATGSSNSLVDDFDGGDIQSPVRCYSPTDSSDGKSSCADNSSTCTGSISYPVSKSGRNNSHGEMNGGKSGGGTKENNGGPRFVMKGYIAALKDGFGFIETAAQDGEIFFHSSSLVGDFGGLEVGQEVEYVVSSKASLNGKHAADMVKPLPRGSISRPEVFPDIFQGIVVRPVRGGNTDQCEYTGLIEDGQGRSYPFGITSMLNKKEILHTNEFVEFQIDMENNAVNIRAIRKKLRATVEAVKGLYGFLSYELDDGKKLFFHMSEVKDNLHLNPGDEVEFVILQNPRNGKSSACSVVKLSETQRPERLLNRLSKLSVDDSGPRLIVVRHPFGPDGTRGFNNHRSQATID